MYHRQRRSNPCGTPFFPNLHDGGNGVTNPVSRRSYSLNKRLRVGDKQKEKVDSRPSSIWDDAVVFMARAQDIFSADEMKVFSGVPADDVVRRHLHKLVQVIA